MDTTTKPRFALLFLSLLSFCSITTTSEHSNYRAINFSQDPFRVASSHHQQIQNKKPFRRIQFGQRLNPEGFQRSRGDGRKRLLAQERSEPIKTYQWRRPEAEPRRQEVQDNVGGESRSEHVRASKSHPSYHSKFGQRTAVSNEASWPSESHYHGQGPAQQRVQLESAERNSVFLSNNQNPKSSFDQEELAFVVDFGKGETIRVHGNPNSKKLHLDRDDNEKNKETVSKLLKAILQNREGVSIKINGEKYKTKVIQQAQEQNENLVGQASQIQESRTSEHQKEIQVQKGGLTDQDFGAKKPRRFKYAIKNTLENNTETSNEEEEAEKDSVSSETSQKSDHSYHYKIKEFQKEHPQTPQQPQAQPAQPYRFRPPFQAHNAFFNSNGFFAQPQFRREPPQSGFGPAFQPPPPQFAFDSLVNPFTQRKPPPQIHGPPQVHHQSISHPNKNPKTYHFSSATQPHQNADPFHVSPQPLGSKANAPPTPPPIHFVSSTQRPQGKPFTILQHTSNHLPSHYGPQQHHSSPTRKSHSYVFQQIGTGPSSLGFSFNLDNGEVDQYNRDVKLGSHGPNRAPQSSHNEGHIQPSYKVSQPTQPSVANQPTVSSLPRLHSPPPRLSQAPHVVQKPLVVLKSVPLQPEPQPEPKIVRHRSRRPRRRKNKSRQPKLEFTSTTATPLSIHSPTYVDDSTDPKDDQDFNNIQVVNLSPTSTASTTTATTTTITSSSAPQPNDVFFIVSTATPGTIIQAIQHKASNQGESSRPLAFTPTAFLSTLPSSVTTSRPPIQFSTTPAVPDPSPFPFVTGSIPNQFSVTTAPVPELTTTPPQVGFPTPTAFPQPIISSTGSPGIRSKPLRPRTQPTTAPRPTTTTTKPPEKLKITARSKIIKIKNFRKNHSVEQFRANLRNRARTTIQSSRVPLASSTPLPIGIQTDSNNFGDNQDMESREESSSLTTNQEALNFKLEFKPNLDSQTIINNFSGEFEDLTELPLPFEGFSVFDEPTTLFATTQSQPTSVFESTESQSSTAFPSTKSHSTNVYGSTLNQETTVFESPQSQPTVVFESTQSEPNVKVASTQSKSPTTSESTQATVNTTPFSITDSTTYYPVNPSAKPLSILSNSIIEQSSTKSEPKLDSDLVLLEPHFVKPTLASEGIELEAKIHDAYKDQKFVGETVPPTVSTIFPTTTSIPRPVIVRTRFRSTMEPTTSPRSVTSTTARSSTERTSRKFFRSRRPLNRQNFLRNKIEELEAPSTRSEESNEVLNSSTEMAMTNGFESLRTSRKKKPSAQEDIEIFNGVSVVQIPANLKRQPESIVIEPIFEEVPNGSESLEDVSTEQSFTVVIEEESEKSNSPIRIRPTFPNRPTSRKVATVKKKRPRPLTAIRRPVIRNQQTQKETVKRLLKNLRKHRQKIKARKEILREAAPIERKEVAKERPSKTIQNSRQTDSNSFVRSTNAPDKSSLSSLPPAISINTKLTGITPIISPSPISTTTETVTEAATSPFTTPDTTASTSFKVANTTTIASTASLSTRTTATTAPSIATTSTTSKVATATANTTTATTTTVSTTTATATTTTTTATTTTTTTTATTTTTTATTTTTTTTETTTATTSASTTFITTISEGTTTTNTSTSTTAATSKADSPIPARSTTTASSTTKTSAVTSEAPTTFSTIDLEDEEVTSPWPTPSSTYFPITGDSLETETDLETIASISTFSFPNPVNDIRIDTDLQFKQSNLGGSLDDLSMESVTLEPQPLTGLPSDDSNPFSVKPRRPPLSRLEELDSIENENEEESVDLTDATLSSRERFKLQLLRNKYRRQSSHEALFSKKSFKSGSDESSGVSGPSSKHPTHNRVGLSRLNRFMQRNSKELKSLSSESITRKTSTEAPLSTTEPTMNKSSILQDKIKTHLENIEKAARRVLSQRNRRRPSFFGRHSRTTKSATSTTTPKTTTTMTTTTAASTVSIMTASEKFSPEIMDVGEIKKTMNTDKSVGVYESSTTTSKSTPEMESSTVSNNKADSSAGTLRADVNSQNLEVEAFTTEFFTHIPTEQPFFSPEVVISSHDPLALNSGDESLNEHQSLLF